MDDESTKKQESKTTFGAEAGEGCGCLMICIGIAIIIWAFKGFPGLVT